jgi:hypothetical protein
MRVRVHSSWRIAGLAESLHGEVDQVVGKTSRRGARAGNERDGLGAGKRARRAGVRLYEIQALYTREMYVCQ